MKKQYMFIIENLESTENYKWNEALIYAFTNKEVMGRLYHGSARILGGDSGWGTCKLNIIYTLLNFL